LAKAGTGEASKAGDETWRDCLVCLALATSVAGSGGFAELPKPAFGPVVAALPHASVVAAHALQIGGLGSRGPPA
jgi:hypothetical protein